MSDTTLPQLERTADGFRVRLRYGGAQRGRFTIPFRDDRRAQERAERLRELAALLVAAGMAPPLARDALQTAASATTAHEFEAVARVARGEAEALSKAAKGPARPVTFAALAERWTSGELHRDYPDHVKTKRSVDDDVSRFRRINEIIGPVPLVNFTLEHAEAAMRALPERFEAPTRRQYAQLIAKLLKYAVYPCRIIPASPLPVGFLPKVASTKAKAWLYPDEEGRLMRCQEVPLARRVLYGFLAREGCRLGEAIGLTWGAVDLERGAVRLDENKTDDPRAWALDTGVVRALKTFRAEQAKPEDLLFPMRIDRSAAAREFRSDLETAGIDRAELFEQSDQRMPIRIHDLRGTFVTLSLANGKTETWVADRTGHRSSAMINRYRRAARSATELGLGTLAPLDQAIPEFRPKAAGPRRGGPEGGPKRAKETLPTVTIQHLLSEKPKWRNGRRSGFKIRRGNPSCEFESHLRHRLIGSAQRGDARSRSRPARCHPTRRTSPGARQTSTTSSSS